MIYVFKLSILAPIISQQSYLRKINCKGKITLI